jgi:citronellol/citronellal dehydrogenase
MASLKGQTLFITGASRGIGKEIALKAARSGANIVIAAKTAEPDPRLPGTIYSAAEEIVAAGGKALPLQVDIRDEDAVAAAVAQAAAHFGGIDILVNNASALSVTGTAQTPIKRYDLMMDINVRGTFVCSQAALPYLQKSRNPHILVLSPPINLSPKWLGAHPAYTASKYGMSLIAMGMAEELKAQGIAVNALWPKTIIATSALKVAGAGMAEMGRLPKIMADAAYEILTRQAREFTGQTLLDEDVLRAVGVTDFDQYLVKPGTKPIIDLFVDVE